MARNVVKEIRRATRRKFGAEEKIPYGQETQPNSKGTAFGPFCLSAHEISTIEASVGGLQYQYEWSESAKILHDLLIARDTD